MWTLAYPSHHLHRAPFPISRPHFPRPHLPSTSIKEHRSLHFPLPGLPVTPKEHGDSLPPLGQENSRVPRRESRCGGRERRVYKNSLGERVFLRKALPRSFVPILPVDRTLQHVLSHAHRAEASLTTDIDLTWLTGDVIAGLTVGIVVVPQSMSYAKVRSRRLRSTSA